jgi:hypothetical protein
VVGRGDEAGFEVEVEDRDVSAESTTAAKTASDQALVFVGSGTTRRARQMLGRLRSQPSVTHPRFELPEWLRQLYEQQEPPERILALLYERGAVRRSTCTPRTASSTTSGASPTAANC